MHDKNPNGMIPIKFEDAKTYNQKGYGIFFAIQKFKTKKRSMDNLEHIRCIAIDIDCKEKTKEEIIRDLITAPLLPSLVVESKNGYHAYWILSVDNWISVSENPEEIAYKYRDFLQERFVPRFKADKNACDVSRVLRMPGFYHLKDPDSPFMVREVFNTKRLYSINQVENAFPIIEKKVSRKTLQLNTKRAFPNNLSISTIKGAIKIEDVAAKIGVEMRPYGDKIKCKCPSPTHKNGDKKPSLFIYPSKNTFYCFGCGVGGDVIKFYNAYVEDLNAHQTILKLKEMFHD